MISNKISFEFTDDAYHQLAQRIRDLDTWLTFAVNLTPDGDFHLNLTAKINFKTSIGAKK